MPECKHEFRVLERRSMGQLSEEMSVYDGMRWKASTPTWKFTHWDVNFYCVHCLFIRTECIQPQYTNSIYTNNTGAVRREDSYAVL
jgi:hypothetical protein